MDSFQLSPLPGGGTDRLLAYKRIQNRVYGRRDQIPIVLRDRHWSDRNENCVENKLFAVRAMQGVGEFHFCRTAER